jgi:hypothetical protein
MPYHNDAGKDPKTGELPRDIDDIGQSVRVVFVDRHLTRSHLVQRVIDGTGIDEEIGTNDDILSMEEMARLYRHVTDDEHRHVDDIIREHEKVDLKEAVVDAYDIRDSADLGRRDMGKRTLIRLFIAIETGDVDPASGILSSRRESGPRPASTNDI